MAIEQILLMAALALMLGWLTRRRGRIEWLLIASVAGVFWLQPPLPLRGLDFLLPLTSVSLTLLSWLLTARPETRGTPATRRTLALVLGTIGVLAVSRYIAPLPILPARPPAITTVLTALAGFAALGFLGVRIQKKHPAAVLWGGFALLLGIFLVLKTPALAREASRLWRLWHHQNTALAARLDIRWVGFSYLAFRLLHTIRDRQTGRLPDVSLGEYVVYALFFPALIAGPIDRIERFVKDLRASQPPFRETLLTGGERLAVGLFKKFVLADTLAMIALNPTSAPQAQSTAAAWALLYAYAFQIYFDFSGYTDIAIGLGQLMGIRLPENFHRPYLQPNLTVFWNNWHMTLTKWFRAYFFNPLARALRGWKKLPAWGMILVSQVATMVLIGLWHGVLWHFVLWGLWHGVGLFVHNRWAWWLKPRAAGLSPRAARALTWGGVLLTFHFVALGWVWFVLPAHDSWQFLLQLGGLQ